MNLSKTVKWLANAVRVAEGGRLEVSAVLHLSENYLVQVNPGAKVSLGEGVFKNANARIVAAWSVRVGGCAMLGSNTCVYDHDFGEGGVSGNLVTSPVEIGEHCWMGANSLITRGARIADRICVGGSRRALPRGGGRLCRRSCVARQVLCCVGWGRERWA